VIEGLKGKVANLETGQSADSFINQDSKFSDVWNVFNAVKGATTTMGDVLGVMGYVTAYNRNIKNGMSKAEALRLFENYNTTQQTKRATEKTSLQQQSNIFVRMIGAFTSSPQLYLNNVMQATSNIRHAVMAGETPSRADVRKLYLNLGMGQMAFYAAAHVFQFTHGDDEDEEAFIKGLQDAGTGVMLMESLPIVGALLEMATDDSPWAGEMGVNPAKNFLKIMQDVKDSDEMGDERVFIKGIEIATGFNLDPLLNGAMGDGDDSFYEALGVSKSYRPGYEAGQSSSSSGPKKAKGGKKGKTGKTGKSGKN
jgi:hypothetical protein